MSSECSETLTWENIEQGNEPGKRRISFRKPKKKRLNQSPSVRKTGKNSKSNFVLVLIFVIGIAIMLYPSVSNWWNVRVSTTGIASYEQSLSDIQDDEKNEILEQARLYNESLLNASFPLVHSSDIPGYEEALNVDGNGMMGYVSINRIDVQLPIYHGTSEAVLNRSAGHLEGSSLPVGGEGTHAILSAHRGLPSAKLFTNLDQLQKGDTFTIKVLDEVLTYEVDQIRIVEPSEISECFIVPDKDYCTLLTCTPYAINTHRLLVRGVRTANERALVVVTNEAYSMDSIILAPVIAIPLFALLSALLAWKDRYFKQEIGLEDRNEN